MPLMQPVGMATPLSIRKTLVAEVRGMRTHPLTDSHPQRSEDPGVGKVENWEIQNEKISCARVPEKLRETCAYTDSLYCKNLSEFLQYD